MAYSGGRLEAAQTLFEEAIALFEAQGARHAAARVWGQFGWVMYFRGRIEEAIRRMEEAFAVLSGDEPDEDLAILAAELDGCCSSPDRRSWPPSGSSSLWRRPNCCASRRISQALNTKSLILYRRRSERLVLLEALCESRSRTTFRRQRCARTTT